MVRVDVVLRVAVVVLSGAAATVADPTEPGLAEFDDAAAAGAGARADVADDEAVGAGVMDVDATGCVAGVVLTTTGETTAGFDRRK